MKELPKPLFKQYRAHQRDNGSRLSAHSSLERASKLTRVNHSERSADHFSPQIQQAVTMSQHGHEGSPRYESFATATEDRVRYDSGECASH